MLKFKEEKVTGIYGITTTFTAVKDDGTPDGADPFIIGADAKGVFLRGRSERLATKQDFESLAKHIGAASQLFMAYRPKITNAAGH